MNPFRCMRSWLLAPLTQQLEDIMEDIREQFRRINEATDNIAADIRRLSDRVTTDLSTADVAEIRAALGNTADTLEAVAAETPED